MSDFDDVVAFNTKFGIPMPTTPTLLSGKDAEFRLARLKEELDEIEEAMLEGDLAGILDGLVDLVYIAHGTASMYGLPYAAAWDAVHQANMKKERVLHEGDSRFGNRWDIKKPTGWVAPDIHTLVERAISGTLGCGVKHPMLPNVCTRPYTHAPGWHEGGGLRWLEPNLEVIAEIVDAVTVDVVVEN